MPENRRMLNIKPISPQFLLLVCIDFGNNSNFIFCLSFLCLFQINGQLCHRPLDRVAADRPYRKISWYNFFPHPCRKSYEIYFTCFFNSFHVICQSGSNKWLGHMSFVGFQCFILFCNKLRNKLVFSAPLLLKLRCLCVFYFCLSEEGIDEESFLPHTIIIST